ncbi:MAG: DUF6266 family protein [Flavobacteriales bacterium]
MSSGAVAPDGSDLTITWSDNSGQSNAFATDELVVVVYSEVLNLFETANPAGTHNLQTINMPMPAYFAGQ